jgi:chaperonin GroEL
LAKNICYDLQMADLLGEIFDVIGEYGRLDIRTGRGREMEREYVEGIYWKGAILSRLMISDEKRLRTDLENAVIVLSDLDVQEPRDLITPLSIAIQGGHKAMLLVVKRLSDAALSLLVSEKTRAKIQVLAVETPGMALSDQAAALEDLAILTGGRPVLRQAGQTLRHVRPDNLGRARRVWSDRHNSGLSGGKGNPRQLRQHLARLRLAYHEAENQEERKKIQERISKLMGGSATLWIGGSTESEIKARRELAERTAQAVRGAVIEGLLPGGGAALLACRPALQTCLAQSTTSAERAAYQILLEATEAPIRALLSNAGHDPSRILADISQAGPGYGFDLHTDQVVNMIEAGVFDPAAVQKDAIRSAISSAALALTIEVVVHKKKPQVSMTP